MMDVRRELNEMTCYVKTILVGGEKSYSVHNNMGEQITVFEKREVAFATAHIHDLIPMSLH